LSLLHLSEFVAQYGYLAVFGLIVVQSFGIPMPGEAALIAAAIYAQHTGRLSIVAVVAVAAAASIIGSAMGYWIGMRGGAPLLAAYGRRIGLTPARVRLGEYLFRLHGGKIMLFGRFMAVLRVYEAVLAGTYRMPFDRFMLFNVLGAVIWAGGVGYAAFALGGVFTRLEGLMGWVFLGLGAALLTGGFLYLRRQEGALQAKADAALLSPEAAG